MPKTKEYNNGEVTVLWKPDLCIHSGICVKGLPQVFQPKERPWIKINEASSEQIVKQVGECPSGALSMKNNSNNKNNMSDTDTIEVTILENGPLMVKGAMSISKPDGSKEHIKDQAAFCRCGASGNKPFCDGSHTSSDFKG